MTRTHGFLFAVGLVVGLMIAGRYVLLAQDRPGPAAPDSTRLPRQPPIGTPKVLTEPAAGADRGRDPVGTKGLATVNSLQDAIVRPYSFPFARPTSLEQVCTHLRQTLKAPVVLDLAALDRQQVEPDNTVQLELEGVRLKTGLKLLLDQVGLTFHIVAEDNLLIITDREGSTDPADRIWSELSALHRDVHDLQDAIDELSEFIGGDKMDGPRVRKPTIIEEMPDEPGAKPRQVPDKLGPPLEKPGGAAGDPPAGARPGPSRVPLSRRRHTL